MKRKYNVTWLLVALFFLFAFPARSQVKIGNTTDPWPFSLLEIESTTGGVRLPQLTGAQAADLKDYLNNQASQTEKERAQGLLIYNTDTKKIEMWNNNNRNWKRLEETVDCVNAESLTISAPLTVFTEYAGDLVLTANITGASPSADPLYTWYRNDEPIAVGRVLTVKKEDLSAQWSGIYTVDVLTCGFSAVGNLSSSPVNITVNKKEPIKYQNTSLFYSYSDFINLIEVSGYHVSASQAPDCLFLRTPKRSISQITLRSGQGYDLVTSHSTVCHGYRSPSNSFSVIFFDAEGYHLTSSPIQMPSENQDISFATSEKKNMTLNGDAWTLYQPKSAEPTPGRYVDFCRSLFFDHPRASLLSKAFLEKYAAYLNSTIIPAGDYWVLDKTFTPLKGTVSYPSGKFTLVTSEASSGNFNVRCIQPATN
ncbi:MAG: hypothetical protein LBP83_00885 [Dysgonamonadaceae bacterium]|jgi:hypothetical protein|nr:hypothetical protein [Dysgonamonadaceae bacterium]